MSYDEIRSVLESQVEEAMKRCECERPHTPQADTLLRQAIERYRQFAEHGLIPEDFPQDSEALLNSGLCAGSERQRS